MSKESETYRLEMLRRLKNRYGKSKPAEVLEAEQVVAKFREEEVRDRAAITRASAPLPEPNLCPQCWFEHGKRFHFYPVPAHDPTRFDAMKCPDCGYIEDRQFKD